MAPRENKNNAHVKFGGTNKEYYGISEVAYSACYPHLAFSSINGVALVLVSLGQLWISI